MKSLDQKITFNLKMDHKNIDNRMQIINEVVTDLILFGKSTKLNKNDKSIEDVIYKNQEILTLIQNETSNAVQSITNMAENNENVDKFVEDVGTEIQAIARVLGIKIPTEEELLNNDLSVTETETSNSVSDDESIGKENIPIN